MKKHIINPRLKKAVISKRHAAIQLEAFNRVAKAIAPFRPVFQRRALQAALIIVAE